MSRKQIIRGNQISDLHEFDLGGYMQKVLIEGKTKDLPVLITLHGGPGSPIPFSVGCRGLFPMFTDRFIMVYWDQLGCGINDYVIGDRFSIDTFVQMTTDLIKEVAQIFPKNKKYIFATSWGSILCAKVLAGSPKIVDGVVVSGQIVKNVFFNDEVLEALRQSKTPRKKLLQIQLADIDHYSPNDLQMISTCLMKYTNAYQNRNGKKSPVGKIIFGLLTSPDYSFADFKAIVLNGYRGNNSLWDEILRLDLSQILEGVQVPYMILQGDTDIVASTAIVKALVASSQNSNLHCKVIGQTGHLPGAVAMEEVYRHLVDL